MYTQVFQVTVSPGPPDWRPYNWDYGWSFWYDSTVPEQNSPTCYIKRRYINRVKSAHPSGDYMRDSTLHVTAPHSQLYLCSHLFPPSLSLMKKAQISLVTAGLDFSVQSLNTGVIGIA